MASTTMGCTHLVPALSVPLPKSRFLGAPFVPSLSCSNGSRVCMASSEWLPGQPRPAHLDGSSPGDFGFDPLGLAEVPENFARFKESELIHCRWAMLAVPGILLPEALGLGNWVDAQKWAATPGGQATYLGVPVPWGNLSFVIAFEFFAIAFSEALRNEEQDPEKRKYPGGPFDPLGFSKDPKKFQEYPGGPFDPLGFSKDPKKFQEYKVKELKNGRLALLAFVGFAIQAVAYPGTGPLENLATHLADPWHRNIGEIVIPRSIL